MYQPMVTEQKTTNSSVSPGGLNKIRMRINSPKKLTLNG